MRVACAGQQLAQGFKGGDALPLRRHRQRSESARNAQLSQAASACALQRKRQREQALGAQGSSQAACPGGELLAAGPHLGSGGGCGEALFRRRRHIPPRPLYMYRRQMELDVKHAAAACTHRALAGGSPTECPQGGEGGGARLRMAVPSGSDQPSQRVAV